MSPDGEPAADATPAPAPAVPAALPVASLDAELASWLSLNGFAHLGDLFGREGIDMAALPLLTETSLHLMGVPLGSALKLLRARDAAAVTNETVRSEAPAQEVTRSEAPAQEATAAPEPEIPQPAEVQTAKRPRESDAHDAERLREWLSKRQRSADSVLSASNPLLFLQLIQRRYTDKVDAAQDAARAVGRQPKAGRELVAAR